MWIARQRVGTGLTGVSSVCAGETCKETVERMILLNEEDDVLDEVGVQGSGARSEVKFLYTPPANNPAPWRKEVAGNCGAKSCLS